MKGSWTKINQESKLASEVDRYSTCDHLQVIAQIVEKSNEYQMPLCLGFVDYEKAFDSVEYQGIIEALEQQKVGSTYVETLVNLYNNCISEVQVQGENSVPFEIQKGVRQGDTLSPKIFNAGLEQVFRSLRWENKGVRVNGEKLNHLRFADDIVLISNNANELQNMLTELDTESRKLGLKINMRKTKVMFNSQIPISDIRLEGQVVDAVEEYTYLGQQVTMAGERTGEIKRRLAAGWGAFAKYNDLMRSKLPVCLKRKVYRQCIEPTMTYGCQTWAMTKRMQERLRTTQRSMERAIIGVTRRDRKTNAWVRQQSGVEDILAVVKRQKWRWAGHIARMEDSRWTKLVTEWIPLDGKRERARPKARWEDDITKFLGATWVRIARDRSRWKNHEKAFIQQWIENG